VDEDLVSGVGPDGTGPGAAGDRLGTAREEAARLLEAVQEWASGASGPDGSGFSPGSVFSAGAGLFNEHLATGAEECKICPVCQGVAALRRVRPEVVEHLLDASASLLAALRAGLEPPHGSPERRDAKVERIDIG
jgi:hypothetical protein